MKQAEAVRVFFFLKKKNSDTRYLSPSFFFNTFFSLEEIHSSDVRNVPVGTDMRHLEAFQIPSLRFCLASLFVSALTFRRLAHLHPRLHRQFVMDQQLSGCGVERVHR